MVFLRGSRRWQPLLLAALVAAGAARAGTDAAVLTVSATVLSKNTCKFSTNSLTLDFLTIDPSATVDRTVNQTLTFVCNGSSASASWFVSAGNGLYSTGPGARRMRNTAVTTEFLPYSLNVSPTSGTAAKGSTVTLSIAGTVAMADFQMATPGSYSDSVTITVSP